MNANGAHGRPDPFGPPDRHIDVGAYALGVLDDSDMAAFERHLAGCETCAARLAEFGTLVPVLAELGRAGIPEPPDGALLDRLLAQVAEQRRVGRRRRRLAAVAAAALIAAGPTAALLATEESHPPAAVQAATVRHSASDRGTGVSATVGLTAKQWGTQIDLKLSDIEGPRTCSLIAVGKQGQRETVANWTVPKEGYDADGRPKAFRVSGATAMRLTDISRFDVVTTQGQRLVSVAG